MGTNRSLENDNILIIQVYEFRGPKPYFPLTTHDSFVLVISLRREEISRTLNPINKKYKRKYL